MTDTETPTDPARRRLLLGGAAALAVLATDTAHADTHHLVQYRDGKTNPDGRFKGEVVLITGATSDVGKVAETK